MVCAIKKVNKEEFTRDLLAKASNGKFTNVYLCQVFVLYTTQGIAKYINAVPNTR